uniref:Copine C-terminal domain-containing protein n=1 Tax=Parascaris univalens TaxID=6257 RepID=A0A915CBR4_PARUN
MPHPLSTSMTHLHTKNEQSPTSMRLNNSSSSASVASRLYTNGTRGSRRGSFGSEPELINFSDTENSIHEFNEICSQVSSLSKKVNDMEEERMTSSEERSRLRTDNAVLTERVHILEEQMQAAEQRWKEKLSEEKARNRDIIARMEREKQLEIESCALKYQVLEKDCADLRREKEKQREEITELRKSLHELRDQFNDSNALCAELEEERIKLEREYKRFREEAQQDIDSSSELVEELSRQTDELRRQNHVPIPRQGSIAEQIVSMEGEIERLRAENKQLREQSEDLQAQLLHDSVERGQSLLADRLPSLAEELNGKDSTELMNALKEQEICNQKLRVYINGILMRVIELHPEILEIKEEHDQASSGAS